MKHIFFVVLALLTSACASSAQNNVLQLNGINQYATIVADPLQGSNAFTIEFWIKPEIGAIRSIINWKTADIAHEICLEDNRLNYWIYEYDGSSSSLIPMSSLAFNNTIESGVWTHIAMTLGGDAIAFYINGTLDRSDSYPYSGIASATWSVGKPVTEDYSTYFSGCIDDLRIWNFVRTGEEINNNKGKELTGTESGLMAYYQMDPGYVAGESYDLATTDNVNDLILYNGASCITDNSILPVELSSFSATNFPNSVELAWTTATEQNNYGFEIERASDSRSWRKIGFVQGSGSSNSENKYRFADEHPLPGKNLYRLKQIDNNGTFKYYDAVEVNMDTPAEFKLGQNNPNPFNPATTISYQIPQNAFVSLKVYDMTGREVATLVNTMQQAGQHTVYWDGKDRHGMAAASGIYLYRIQAGNFVQTRKMNLLK